MIRTLDRMVLGETLPYFFYGVGSFTALVLGGRGLYEVAGKAIEYQIPMSVAVKLLALQAPQIVSYTIPMSVLFSVLFGVGRMSGDFEITALRAAGFNFLRIASPALAFALFVSLASVLANDFIVPKTNARFAAIINEIRLGSERGLQAGQLLFEHKRAGRRDFVLTADSMKNNALTNVVLVEFDDRGRLRRMVGADSAVYGENGWKFRNATLIDPASHGQTRGVVKSSELDKINPETIIKFAQGARELTFAELKQKIRDLMDVRQRQVGRDIRKLQFELYNKLFLPLSSFTFALVGAPLAIKPQRSSGAIGMGYSLIILLLYYVLLSVTRTFAMGEGLPVLFWAAFPPALVACIGAGLFWKVIR